MVVKWSDCECLVEGCTLPAYTYWLCRPHSKCFRRWGHVEMSTNYLTPSERLRTEVVRVGECLVWTGCTDKAGYGRLVYKGRRLGAHAAAWIEAGNPPVPRELKLDHTCHTPPCINVQHLRLATNKENAENLGGLSSRNTSGFRGVSWNKKAQRWVARVVHNGKVYDFGKFATPEAANVVVLRKRLELFTHNDEDRKAANTLVNISVGL